MKKCPNCGAEAEDSALFCSSCGASLPEGKSGSFCSHCGTKIEGNPAFCPKCGERLKGDSASNTKASPSFKPTTNSRAVLGETRSIALWVVISILTCGIGEYIWFGFLTDDVNTVIRDDWDTSGWTAVLLSIITCNIYMVYAIYKLSSKLDDGKDSSFGVLNLIVSLFIPLISIALIQDKFNKLVK